MNMELGQGEMEQVNNSNTIDYNRLVVNKRKYEMMDSDSGPSNNCSVSELEEVNNINQEDQNQEVEIESKWLSQYGIVKKVMQYLPIRDLLASTQTSKYWNEVGKVVRIKRHNKANTILYHPYSEQGKTNEAVEYFNDIQISPEVNQLFNEIEPSFIEILDGNWSKELLKEWETCFKKAFLSQFSESQMIIFFATKSFLNYIRLRKQKFSFKTEHESFFGHLIPPNRIPILSAFGCGLATSLPNSTNVFEMERTELPMVSGLVIPKVPGLHLRVISFDKSLIAEKYRRRRSVNSSNCMEILRITEEEKEKLKAIVICDADSYGRYTNPFMDAVFHYIKENPKTCLAGGNVHNTLTSVSNEDTTKQLGFGLAISADDDRIKVGSVAMTEPGISVENENKLKKFQSLISNGEDSFAFMFACNGRGAQMHQKEHVEVNLFRKYFPTTPIIGVFTGGEIAHEYLPGENPSPPKSRSSLEFTFSTVFLFVACKQPDST